MFFIFLDTYVHWNASSRTSVQVSRSVWIFILKRPSVQVGQFGFLFQKPFRGWGKYIFWASKVQIWSNPTHYYPSTKPTNITRKQIT